MKISIVTISYNQGDYIESAIASIVDQSYVNREYIIVDGGSSDETLNIVERFNSKVTRLLLGPDEGPADGLNKGFAVATGDIFGFINADDVLNPGALEFIAGFFIANQNVDVLVGVCNILDSENRILRKSYPDRVSTFRYAYGGCILLQPSVFFRKDPFNKIGGFNKENKISWDSELFWEFCHNGYKFAYVANNLSGYRLHKEAITGSGRGGLIRSQNHRRIFRNIMGREWRFYDDLLVIIFRITRKLFNPKDTYQRLLFGRIYGRIET